MTAFTDERARVATEEDLKLPWGGRKPGEKFRCYLCLQPFKVGDTWRWQYVEGYPNFLVCTNCDDPTVVDRWKTAYDAAVRMAKLMGWVR